MKIKHSVTIDVNDEFHDLVRAVNMVPEDATDVDFHFNEKYIGYGPTEHGVPTLTITWRE